MACGGTDPELGVAPVKIARRAPTRIPGVGEGGSSVLSTAERAW